jgi:hypothetical protein
MCVDGNLNIIKRSDEKIKKGHVGDGLCSIKLYLTNRSYTLSNNRDNTTYAPHMPYVKLDRLFFCSKWGMKYPMCIVRGFERNVFNHTSILVDLGEHAMRNTSPFRFKLNRLE